MQIFTRLESFSPDPKAPLILGLGNFDGVHLGHRKLLSRVTEAARPPERKQKGKAAVFTFQEHPQGVLHPQNRLLLLTSPESRFSLFRELGIEVCFFIPFTTEFSRIEPEVFVKDILKKKLGVEKIFLGANARFGHERRGDSKLMARLAGDYGFGFEEILPVESGGEIVSSSRIRNYVQEGRFEEAGQCLGRPFSILAKVVRGDGRGKSLGYPTANLEIGPYALPPFGVYPVKVRVVGERQRATFLSGVLNYGCRPTFKSGQPEPLLEVFILDFAEDLYGKTLEVVFCPRLRGEITFDGPETLKKQIAQDVENARQYFASRPFAHLK
ncbi:MAG TPA: riboflavin biosynthesis protein RibF [bacterium]|nr:riboflavin biosynthesis protein RibF [bacterium]